jgi:hypothetical protein
MATATTRDQSKSGFIKQLLCENPYANVKVVNEAWQSAGMAGSISPALVNKMRSEAGLAGNLRGKGKAQVAAKTEAPQSTGTMARSGDDADWRGLESQTHVPEVQELIRQEIQKGTIRVRPQPDGSVCIVPIRHDEVHGPRQ